MAEKDESTPGESEGASGAGDTVTVPKQSNETREEILRNAPKGATATGRAFEDELDEQEIPEGEDRGSKTPIDGGEEIVADYSGQEVQKPIGLQAEPAMFVSNGSVNPSFVASPAGLVPASSLGASVEDAQKRIDAHHKAVEESYARKRGEYKALTQAQIDSMTGADLRAVAVDRGYDMGEGTGTRTARRRFAQAQDEDEGLDRGDEPTWPEGEEPPEDEKPRKRARKRSSKTKK